MAKKKQSEAAECAETSGRPDPLGSPKAAPKSSPKAERSKQSPVKGKKAKKNKGDTAGLSDHEGDGDASRWNDRCERLQSLCNVGRRGLGSGDDGPGVTVKCINAASARELLGEFDQGLKGASALFLEAARRIIRTGEETGVQLAALYTAPRMAASPKSKKTAKGSGVFLGICQCSVDVAAGRLVTLQGTEEVGEYMMCVPMSPSARAAVAAADPPGNPTPDFCLPRLSLRYESKQDGKPPPDADSVLAMAAGLLHDRGLPGVYEPGEGGPGAGPTVLEIQAVDDVTGLCLGFHVAPIVLGSSDDAWANQRRVFTTTGTEPIHRSMCDVGTDLVRVMFRLQPRSPGSPGGVPRQFQRVIGDEIYGWKEVSALDAIRLRRARSEDSMVKAIRRVDGGRALTRIAVPRTPQATACRLACPSDPANLPSPHAEDGGECCEGAKNLLETLKAVETTLGWAETELVQFFPGESGEILLQARGRDIEGNRQVPLVIRVGAAEAILAEYKNHQKGLASSFGRGSWGAMSIELCGASTRDENFAASYDFVSLRDIIAHTIDAEAGGPSAKKRLSVRMDALAVIERLAHKILPKGLDLSADRKTTKVSQTLSKVLVKFENMGSGDSSHISNYFDGNDDNWRAAQGEEGAGQEWPSEPLDAAGKMVGVTHEAVKGRLQHILVSNTRGWMDFLLFESLSHGSLDGRNILVDSTSRLWLTGFSKLSTGSLLKDMMTLEACVLFDYAWDGGAVPPALSMALAAYCTDIYGTKLNETSLMPDVFPNEQRWRATPRIARVHELIKALRSSAAWLVARGHHALSSTIRDGSVAPASVHLRLAALPILLALAAPSGRPAQATAALACAHGLAMTLEMVAPPYNPEPAAGWAWSMGTGGWIEPREAAVRLDRYNSEILGGQSAFADPVTGESRSYLTHTMPCMVSETPQSIVPDEGRDGKLEDWHLARWLESMITPDSRSLGDLVSDAIAAGSYEPRGAARRHLRGVVLSGPAGSGKSIGLRRVQVMQSIQQPRARTGSSGGLMPVVVSVPALVRSHHAHQPASLGNPRAWTHQDVEASIAAVCGWGKGVSELFHYATTRPDSDVATLLMLDGFHEITEREQRCITTWLMDLRGVMEGARGSCTVVIATRPTGLAAHGRAGTLISLLGPAFYTHMEPQGATSYQRDAFIRRWVGRSDTTASRIISALDEREDVQLLMRSPMLLSQFMHARRVQGGLLSTGWALFRSSMDLLASRVLSRQLHSAEKGTGDHRAGKVIQWFLRLLAYEMQVVRRRRVFTSDEIRALAGQSTKRGGWEWGWDERTTTTLSWGVDAVDHRIDDDRVLRCSGSVAVTREELEWACTITADGYVPVVRFVSSFAAAEAGTGRLMEFAHIGYQEHHAAAAMQAALTGQWKASGLSEAFEKYPKFADSPWTRDPIKGQFRSVVQDIFKGSLERDTTPLALLRDKWMHGTLRQLAEGLERGPFWDMVWVLAAQPCDKFREETMLTRIVHMRAGPWAMTRWRNAFDDVFGDPAASRYRWDPEASSAQDQTGDNAKSEGNGWILGKFTEWAGRAAAPPSGGRQDPIDASFRGGLPGKWAITFAIHALIHEAKGKVDRWGLHVCAVASGSAIPVRRAVGPGSWVLNPCAFVGCLKRLRALGMHDHGLQLCWQAWGADNGSGRLENPSLAAPVLRGAVQAARLRGNPRLWRQHGLLLAGAGILPRATVILEAVVESKVESHGAEHLEHVVAMLELGEVLRRRGHLDRGQGMFEECIRLLSGADGDSHPMIVDSMVGLSRVHLDRGESGRVIELLEQCLSIRESTVSADHPGAAEILRLKAEVYERQDEYGRAVELLEQAIEVLRAARGDTGEDLARSLFSLADVHISTRSFDKATQVLDSCLEVQQQTPGIASSDMANTVRSMARVLMMRNDPRSATPLFERCLDIWSSGPSHGLHRDAGGALVEMSEAQAASGDNDGALESLLRALETFESVCGKDTTECADVLNNIGAVCMAQRHFAGAAQRFQAALEIHEKVSNSLNNAECSAILRNKAVALASAGDTPGALEALRLREAVQEATVGLDSEGYADTLEYTGELLLRSGEYERAADHFEDAIRILRSCEGIDECDIACIIAKLADCKRHQGHHTEALEKLQGAWGILRELRTPQPIHNATVMLVEANTLRDRGEPTDGGLAREIYTECVATLERLCGPEDPLTLTAKAEMTRALLYGGHARLALSYAQELVEAYARVEGSESSGSVNALVMLEEALAMTRGDIASLQQSGSLRSTDSYKISDPEQQLRSSQE